MDDLFQVILSTSRPVPLAVKYFFDLLDEQAQQHGISDQDTVHIWKTNRWAGQTASSGQLPSCHLPPATQPHVGCSQAASPPPASPCSLPLRFWINIIKNPQFVFDVQTSDNMDAVLLVIAQTFMDACTLADHKLGRVRRARPGLDLHCSRPEARGSLETAAPSQEGARFSPARKLDQAEPCGRGQQRIRHSLGLAAGSSDLEEGS